MLLMTLLALVGCDGSSTTTTKVAAPTSLVLVRTVPTVIQGAPGDLQPLNVTISDKAAVQAFYQRTLALPQRPELPNGALISCSKSRAAI
jgi:hypothetical protein